MKYINFQKDEQINFMKLIKSKTKLTWESLAHQLSLSRSMIFFYRNGHSKILKENYERLCSLANIEMTKNDYIEIKNKTQSIKISKLNEDLAEFIGILAGDGHLSPLNYEVSVTCHNIDDRDYVDNHIAILFFLYSV